MEKMHTRSLLRLAAVWIILSSLLGAFATLERAEVVRNELRLTFSQAISIKDVSTFTLKKPYRQVIDIRNARLNRRDIDSALRASSVSSFRIAQYQKNIVRVVIEVKKPYTCTPYQPPFSRRLYHVPLPGSQLSSSPGMESVAIVPTSETRTKRYTVVVDAGHGGSDTGAIGAGRYKEKVLVLQIARRVVKHLKARKFNVRMTRSNDQYIKLKKRTHYANRHEADIFVSIHANAIANKKKFNTVHGIETYFLDTSKSEKAKRIAALENSVVLDKSDQVSQSIILSSILTRPKIVESHKLAIDIQSKMLKHAKAKYRNVHDGGVRAAPFWVLVGAQMPSVLVEVGYLTNPIERKRLFSSEYQERLAKGIAEGIATYLANHEKQLN
jgi:N-acetylmuramoyl-L-alanine amidase